MTVWRMESALTFFHLTGRGADEESSGGRLGSPNPAIEDDWTMCSSLASTFFASLAFFFLLSDISEEASESGRCSRLANEPEAVDV